MGNKTVAYSATTVREHHMDIDLSQFDIPMDVDTAVIRVHFTRDDGRMVSKTIRLSSFDLTTVRRSGF